MRKRLHFLRLVLWFAPAVILVAQTEHKTAFTGTWKLNPAKSTHPSGPPPQSFTARMMEDGKTILSGIDDNGKAFEWGYPWSDGKEVPVEGIKNATATQTIRDHTCDAVMKEAGKPYMTVHSVLAADGKSMRATVTTIDEKGHRTPHIEFYEKQ